MSEKWQNVHDMSDLDNKECCRNCKYKICDKICNDYERCHRVRYDHEGYPTEERYLMFESKLN